MTEETIQSLTAKLKAQIVQTVEGQRPDVVMPALLSVAIQMTMQAMGLNQIDATQLIIDSLVDAKRGKMS